MRYNNPLVGNEKQWTHKRLICLQRPSDFLEDISLCTQTNDPYPSRSLPLSYSGNISSAVSLRHANDVARSTLDYLLDCVRNKLMPCISIQWKTNQSFSAFQLLQLCMHCTKCIYTAAGGTKIKSLLSSLFSHWTMWQKKYVTISLCNRMKTVLVHATTSEKLQIFLQ